MLLLHLNLLHVDQGLLSELFEVSALLEIDSLLDELVVLELKRKDKRLAGVELQLLFDKLGRNLIGWKETEVGGYLPGLSQLRQGLDLLFTFFLLAVENDQWGTRVQSETEVSWGQVSEERDRVLADELGYLQ